MSTSAHFTVASAKIKPVDRKLKAGSRAGEARTRIYSAVHEMAI